MRLRLAKFPPPEFAPTNDVPRLKDVGIRGNCEDIPRPCPFASCHHHLLLEVTRAGNIKFRTQAREPDQLPPDRSCALDMAEEGGHTLEVVGTVMGVTRERVRQIEVRGLQKIKQFEEELEDAPESPTFPLDDL